MDKEWSTEHPSLKDGSGSHEPPAVYRMHKAGVPSQNILKLLRLKGTELVKQIALARGEYESAEHDERPIHEALIDIPKEKN
jgi:hypothetical protein